MEALQLQPDLLLLLLLLLWGPETGEGQRNSDDEYMLKVPNQVTVQQGLCVHVPCEFSYPEYEADSAPAYGFWFQQGSSINKAPPVATNNPKRAMKKDTEGRFYLVGEPLAKNCSLDIRDARKKDNGSYFFRLERGNVKFNYRKNMLSVNVTALTHKPHIAIPETLEAGQLSNLTCSVPWACERGTPPLLSWTRDSEPLLGPRATHSLVLTFTPQPQDHGTKLTCLVTLPAVNLTRKMIISLNVSYAPRNLTVTTWEEVGGASTVVENGSSLPIPESQSLRLLCVADSKPPARLSWSWGTLSLCPSQPSNPGLLELSPVHLKLGGEVTCQVQNALGSQHLTFSLSLQSNTAKSGVMWGVFVGSGTTALIFLFIGIILLLVKCWSRKPTRSIEEVTDLNALRGSVSQSPLVEFQADDNSPPKSLTAMATPTDTEEEEIHYASLNFREMKPKDPQKQQNTEYSEIKINK